VLPAAASAEDTLSKRSLATLSSITPPATVDIAPPRAAAAEVFDAPPEYLSSISAATIGIKTPSLSIDLFLLYVVDDARYASFGPRSYGPRTETSYRGAPSETPSALGEGVGQACSMHYVMFTLIISGSVLRLTEEVIVASFRVTLVVGIAVRDPEEIL
jgi:hypothetical protein